MLNTCASGGTGGQAGSPQNWIYTYYVRDAQGNIMATYNRRIDAYQSGFTNVLELNDHSIYGNSRLGVKKSYNIIAGNLYNAPLAFNGNGAITNNSTGSYPVGVPATGIYKRFLGYKEYELTNHLGNVLSVVNDRKQVADEGILIENEFQSGSCSNVPSCAGWSTISPALLSIVSQELVVSTSGSVSQWSGAYMEMTTEIGARYNVSCRFEQGTSNFVKIVVYEAPWNNVNIADFKLIWRFQ